MVSCDRTRMVYERVDKNVREGKREDVGYVDDATHLKIITLEG